jgi:hypothetical protein
VKEENKQRMEAETKRALSSLSREKSFTAREKGFL